jgi:hypothetical protein
MIKRTAALASAILLVLALAASTGSAAADPASQDHGNSANAPGQLKKSSVSSQGGADANANASTAGVKPTSSTAKGNHNTSCTTGGGTGSSATCTSTGSSAATAQTAAHADASKRYGNSSTAAEVANSNGAPAGTTLTGPGNSQPHKVTDCKHKHAVDVHAVKSYSAAACASTSHTVTSGANVTVTGNVAATATHPNATGAATTQQGGVLGATAAAGHGNAAPQGGVLGAIQGSLPFTGLPLWVVVAAGVMVIALGLTLRRQTRVTA